MSLTRAEVRVTGTVQGVGFRPFVYRHATALGLHGFVRNDSGGVLIDVEGDTDRIAELTRLLTADAPPLARVASVSAEARPPVGHTGFQIVESVDAGAPSVPVSVDSGTCASCLVEVDDPLDRRFRYPFTNCTDCGPRYTIVLRVPYDRPATTMAGFEMCPSCRREYDDPADRRFHAQPNACPDCGPTVAWRDPAGTVLASGADALAAAVAALAGGHVVAIKGIGGFHLAADATDDVAVAQLRRRKARDDKPFAVMVVDVADAERWCEVDERARAALTSPRRPIVLVPRRHGSPIADGVAPALPELGIFLPYSPLHHLLLAGVGRPLVMTSGNISDEPIAHADDDAVARLGPLVDGLLTHDRPIHIRCDDSVVRVTPTRLQVLRRSRGYVPEPISLPFEARRQVLAVGAELKSTISVAKGYSLVPSHHIGDLEHLATHHSFVQALGHLGALYGVTPEVVAHDLHPEYRSTKLALELDLPCLGVQHHHAHIAACMVEHGRTAAVLGLAFDGLGYGPDGSFWGGELLLADLTGYRRLAHLAPVAMPGGTAAIREPWRMAAVWVALASGRGAVGPALPGVDPSTREAVLDLAESSLSPATTSVGRLFDAAAALLGGRRRVSYEAQAAIELEALARTVARADAPRYEGAVTFTTAGDGLVELDPSGLVATMVAERDRGVAPAIVAAGLHESLGRAAAELAARLAPEHGVDAVVLTGGVFQNARLTEVVEDGLRATGLRVLVHESVPPNDGGISVGQAAIAAYTEPSG